MATLDVRLADGTDATIVVPTAGQSGNRGWITDQTTSNAQGAGGPTIVALIQTTVKATGIFSWRASAELAAVAADVVTWTVTLQSGNGAVTTTGGTFTGTSNGNAPTGGLALISTGVAGTGIVITAGAGASQTLVSSGKTIGTAAVNDLFAASGLAWSNTLGAPYTDGTNVFLCLAVTDSVANRAVSNINLSLEELST